MFVIFQRLHSRTLYEGTGVGLALVKKIVDNHRGFIKAEGKKGEGALFTVILPLR
jgi:light-regulated signal transduction histidine kinase (bacteriophytochrome)